MSVSLEKKPQLLHFLAITTDAGTPAAKVHRLTLTPADTTYDDVVNDMHVEMRAIEGAEIHNVIAVDRSSAYAAARLGEIDEELFSAWLEQDRLAAGL
ncbi:hypothetical protein [Streptomyces subrutilus]|uniref:Uncharacterized protein n=1 Tax=Streptomyces subrutilus TaxID=36818 RepID=A0A1E5NXR2_9ACTN|nr:hypothetical protein [Streptomyces subrutilus]OEJ21041.1 hypothetical protein BGK67_34660 [Streptomyces subrutilus]